MSKYLRLVAVVLLSSVAVQSARGQAVSPDFLGVVNNGNGTFTYQYNVLLSNNTTLNTGNQFVLYDFHGLTSSVFTDSAVAGLFVPTMSLIGPMPPGSLLLGADTPSVFNVVLTYSGGPASNNTGADINLGRLDIVSTQPLDAAPLIAFAANSFNADNGAPAGNQSFVRGPVPIPEPGAAALLLFTSAALARRRSLR